MTDPGIGDIGKQFVATYYQTFDAGRDQVVKFYHPKGQLSFEGHTSVGTQAIAKKLTELPFKTVQHVISTIDVQQVFGNQVAVFVIGQLKADNDPPHGFSQSFILATEGSSMYVINDMFRLHLHHM